MIILVIFYTLKKLYSTGPQKEKRDTYLAETRPAYFCVFSFCKYGLCPIKLDLNHPSIQFFLPNLTINFYLQK